MLVAFTGREPCESNTTKKIAASLHSKSLSGVLVRAGHFRGCSRNRMPLSPFVPASSLLKSRIAGDWVITPVACRRVATAMPRIVYRNLWHTHV